MFAIAHSPPARIAAEFQTELFAPLDIHGRALNGSLFAVHQKKAREGRARAKVGRGGVAKGSPYPRERRRSREEVDTALQRMGLTFTLQPQELELYLGAFDKSSASESDDEASHASSVSESTRHGGKRYAGPTLLRALPAVDGEHIELSPSGADSRRTLAISPSREPDGEASAAASPQRPARSPDDDRERAPASSASPELAPLLLPSPPKDGHAYIYESASTAGGEPTATSPTPSGSTSPGPSSNACFDAALPPVQLSLYRQQQEQQLTWAEQLARRGRGALPDRYAAPAAPRARQRRDRWQQKPRCEAEAPPSYGDGLRGRKLYKVPASLRLVSDDAPDVLATTARPSARGGRGKPRMRVFTAFAASAR